MVTMARFVRWTRAPYANGDDDGRSLPGIFLGLGGRPQRTGDQPERRRTDLAAGGGGDRAVTTRDRLLLFLPMSNFQQRMMYYAAIWYDFDIAVTDYTQLYPAIEDP